MLLACTIFLAIAAQPTEIRLAAPATAITIAIDGSFAVGFENGSVDTYNADRNVIASFHERGPVRSLALSPDGKLLATGFTDDGRNVTTAIWTREGKLIRYLTAFEGKPAQKTGMYGFALHTTSRLAWSPDGKLLAAEHDGHMDTGVRIWSPDGKLVSQLGWPGRWRELPQSERLSMAAGVKQVAFSPDGKTIVTPMDDGFVRAWRTDGRVKWQSCITKEDGVSDADFSENGSRVYFTTGSDKSRVGCLNAKTGNPAWSIEKPSHFSSLCGLDDDLLLATTGSSLDIVRNGQFHAFARFNGTITKLSAPLYRTTLLVATTEPIVYLVPFATLLHSGVKSLSETATAK